jgi:NDP-mannose synthase
MATSSSTAWRQAKLSWLMTDCAPDAAAQVRSFGKADSSPEHAIVLAGGRGARLLPHTLATPKPLIRLGGKTILEIILAQLRSCGVSRVTMCVSFMANTIMKECGDGRRFGVDIDYCVDVEPRGTAGPLAAVQDWAAPAVVMNADILTQLDFAALFEHHLSASSLLTIASHVQELVVDYGVLDIAQGDVVALAEKPRFEMNVSSGIYVASPDVREFVPSDRQFGMNDLVHRLLQQSMPVSAYRFSEDWHDIGTPGRLAEARRSLAANPARYLPTTSHANAARPQGPAQPTRDGTYVDGR